MSLLDRLKLEHPVVQAGMGGGIANGELAGAVAAAGALGTVGILPPGRLRRELERAHELADGGAVAANLLVPFATRGHAEACAGGRAAAIVLHGGFDRRLVEQLRSAGAVILHTVGTSEGGMRALADGADGLVVQGREAGGHLVGVEPALDALARLRAIAGHAPLLLAGGIASGEDVHRALSLGADAAVAGTRFLLTEECPAHPLYKQAVLRAERTLETNLFGFAWPMRHRVVPNAATARWCRRDVRGPRAVRALQALSTPLARLPLSVTAGTVQMQRATMPLFGPGAPLRGMPDRIVEAAALYAGQTALRITSLLSAGDAVALLAGHRPAPAPQSPTMPSS